MLNKVPAIDLLQLKQELEGAGITTKNGVAMLMEAGELPLSSFLESINKELDRRGHASVAAELLNTRI